MKFFQVVVGAAALFGAALAQDEVAPIEFPFPTSCTGVAAARYKYTLAAGWKATKISGGLRQPRTILFDNAGHMLVLQATMGISAHTFGPDGCINSTKVLVQDRSMNHGLSITPDNKYLYSSSERMAFRWPYDPVAMTLGTKETIVQGISTGIHSTRTIHVVPNKPNLVIVAVGSNANLDATAGQIRACVKVFDMDAIPAGGYQYNTQGHMLGWGLRNEVAIAFDPNGMAWGAENSGDDFRRNGQDIHIDNPAEELNYLGDPSVPNDNWYGYPTCFTAWGTNIPGGTFKKGDQFVLTANATFTDATCGQSSKAPRLPLMPHSAPIDAHFDKNGDNLYISFHGSWDRQPPTGYKVVQVPYHKLESGEFDPVAAPDAVDGYNDIFSTTSPESCQTQTLTRSSCLRMAAVQWDPSFKRLFVSSDNDAEGEIFVLSKEA